MGKKTGPNPTDRAKSGTKRSTLTDANGIPLGIVVGPANLNDHKLVEETIESIPIRRPRPTKEHPQGMCMDKGYDNEATRQLLMALKFAEHIRSRGEEIQDKRSRRKKARRWVVERTHSWINRFRRLLVRWEKYERNYLALLHLACAIICSQQALSG